jgi:hypothetical protein
MTLDVRHDARRERLSAPLGDPPPPGWTTRASGPPLADMAERMATAA